MGKVLRERMLDNRLSKASVDVPLSYNPFGNVTFEGEYDLYYRGSGYKIILTDSKQVQNRIKSKYLL